MRYSDAEMNRRHLGSDTMRFSKGMHVMSAAHAHRFCPDLVAFDPETKLYRRLEWDSGNETMLINSELLRQRQRRDGAAPVSTWGAGLP